MILCSLAVHFKIDMSLGLCYLVTFVGVKSVYTLGIICLQLILEFQGSPSSNMSSRGATAARTMRAMLRSFEL